jgi:diadenosine tetraphosphatase ApaH/serine/threonine PP2A family protein phosphatase
MSRIAVIADIHGNSLALDAVLADLDTQGGADLILNLGDLAVFGPDPVGVLELLDQRRPMRYVRGNTDRYLAEGTYPRGQSSDSWEEQVLASFPWTAEQLGAAGLKFLADLPTCQYLPKQLIMAVHGTIYSDEGNIRPDTPISELEPLVPITPFFRLLLCGHTLLPMDRSVVGRRIVNVGSVGLPFDGDPRASYVLIDLEPPSDDRIEFRRVAYDIEAVVRQLEAVDHPTKAISTYNLRTARPLGAGRLIYTEAMRQGNSLVAAA